jgi:hypothetical protein
VHKHKEFRTKRNNTMIPVKPIKLDAGFLTRARLQLAVLNSSPKCCDDEPKAMPRELATTLVYAAAIMLMQKQPPKLLTGSDTSVIDADRVVDVTDEKTSSTNPFDGMVDSAQQKQVSTNTFDTEVKTLALAEEVDVSEEASDTNPVSQMNPGTNIVADGRAEDRRVFDEMLEAANRVNLNIDDSEELIPTVSREGLFQNVTLGKVAKVAGFALLVTVGGTAAYHFYPIIAGIQGATALEAGRAVATNIGTAALTIHGSMIQPGFAGTLLLANLIKDFAVIPVAKMTLPVLLPVISTAVVTTLTTLAVLYVASKMWIVASAALWNTGSTVANKMSKELDQTLPGQVVKFAVVKAVAPYTNVIKALMAPKESEVSEEARNEFLLTDSEESSGEEVDGSNRIENGNSTETKTKRTKTQKKAQQTFGNAVLWAGLYTVGLGAAGYLVVNWMKRDS